MLRINVRLGKVLRTFDILTFFTKSLGFELFLNFDVSTLTLSVKVIKLFFQFTAIESSFRSQFSRIRATWIGTASSSSSSASPTSTRPTSTSSGSTSRSSRRILRKWRNWKLPISHSESTTGVCPSIPQEDQILSWVWYFLLFLFGNLQF